ncbi:hypothetical protein HYH03_013076 [Edaphochlamys debaryana]|uniref:Uncharacterized protein n=1 Tax=Edaphochlamys debaryana TaxID=47281 RepID=A0A835XWZ5_9CHLO|nr:hypothetical protein HYH03_013076 [Edaphochlamys debaryana]|eukprot:KAG2488390.1 hypothetical protein HYH03_013076 [Edaphochlamys debaryana]
MAGMKKAAAAEAASVEAELTSLRQQLRDQAAALEEQAALAAVRRTEMEDGAIAEEAGAWRYVVDVEGAVRTAQSEVASASARLAEPRAAVASAQAVLAAVTADAARGAVVVARGMQNRARVRAAQQRLDSTTEALRLAELEVAAAMKRLADEEGTLDGARWVWDEAQERLARLTGSKRRRC